MGYNVKWVEDNLGVTRKALRGFEKMGLMPENKDRQYRDYDDAEIDRIWTIRVFQGMGYSLKEIVSMVNDTEFDFDSSISQKVLELEEKKKQIERHLGYAKMIKLTGRFPLRPKKMGEVQAEEFKNQAFDNWNIINDAQGIEYEKLAETILSKLPEEWENTDLGYMFSVFESITTTDVDLFLVEYVLPKAIVRRMDYGASHPDIQFMIKMIYDNWKAFGMESVMTVRQFSRFYSSSYLVGDIAKLKTRDYSKAECEFIAEAVAIFGGYKNHNELLEEEMRYGWQNERCGELL